MSSGLGMVTRNKRYIIWFFLLNLVLAWFGVTAFSVQAHTILDQSLVAHRLSHGFPVAVFAEMLARPDFGTANAVSVPAVFFAFLFFVATALFLPGIFLGYASSYRLPREDFFRACGRNLWRFIRLMVIAGLVMGIVAGVLFALSSANVKHADESTNELLPFEMQMLGLFVIFLVMTTLRIWFDLAEADVVLSDQRAVRKSIALGFLHTFKSLARLLGSYFVSTLVAAIILLGGLWTWVKFVAPESVGGAFLVGQLTLLLLLIPRFWQRGMAVSYWQQKMMMPVYVEPIMPPMMQPPVPVTATPEPESPVSPTPPLTPAES